MEIITQAYWPKAQQYQNGIWGELSFRAGGAYGIVWMIGKQLCGMIP